jgi:hypothetical protein
VDPAIWIALIFVLAFVVLVVVLSFRHRGDMGSLLNRTEAVTVTPAKIDIRFFRDVVAEREQREVTDEEGEATLGRIGQGRILWVDDDPRNNEREIRILRDLDVEVDMAISNTQAVDLATRRGEDFDLILSDIDRGPEGPKAGLALPRLLDEAGVTAAVAFYVGHAERESTDDGDPVFDTPSELLEFIGDRLGGGAGPKAGPG